MRHGHESRPYNADNAEQQASSHQGPEVTSEGMSFGFRIRGPPEEQAHLVLHAFVSVAIMDRGVIVRLHVVVRTAPSTTAPSTTEPSFDLPTREPAVLWLVAAGASSWLWPC
jgi:hypothetical protein